MRHQSEHDAWMTDPRQAEIRYRVDPGDVPPEKAARRLHLTLERFQALLPKLLKRGFPPVDPDTGMYDLEAIDVWRRNRHRGLVNVASTFPLAPAHPDEQPSRPVRRLGEKTHGGHGAPKRS